MLRRGPGTRVLVSLLFAAISCSLASAHMPARSKGQPRPNGADIFSLERRLDWNRMSLALSNVGSLGFDIPNGSAGGWYPRGSDLTLLFASGLWLGALTESGLRVAVAEYSQEYQPGEMLGSTPDNPDLPEYQVWKVARWNGAPSDSAHVEQLVTHPSQDPIVHHSWSEYMANAVPKGAPWKLHRLPLTSTPQPDDSVDVPGPDVPGDRMTWCVFNDADPNAHTNDAGSTEPLGAEVQQTVFAFDDPGPMGDAVFIHWRVRNGGTLTWDSLRAGYWADPDIGGVLGVTDDKTGCDTTRSLAFAYNGQPIDGDYGAAPPVFGAILLASSPAPPPGTTPGMYACRSYVNGTDPTAALQTWFNLSGLAADGSPLVDPFGRETRYHFDGDPLAGTGWLDPTLLDKRMLASAAPRSLAPGDTFDLWVAVLVAPEPGLANALAAMRCRADHVIAVFASGFARPFPPAANCTAGASCPRPSHYWRTQASGAGSYTLPDITALATLIDQHSVALDFGADPLGGLYTALAPGGDARQRAVREHAAFLANMLATQSGLQPVGEAPVSLNALIPVTCEGVPGATTGEMAVKAAEFKAVSAAYRNHITTNRRALEGVNAGFPAFGGGAGAAFDFFGSTLDPSSQPDSFPAMVRVRFSHTQTQQAHRYLRLERQSDGTAPPQGRGYLYGGYVDVPFTVMDSATGEPMVAAFVERTLTDDFGTILPPELQPLSHDGTWGPTTDAVGDREYLVVFRRPYSDTPLPEFTLDGAFADASLPGLYFLWSRLRTDLDVIDDGDEFAFGFGFAPTTGTDGILRDLAGLSLADPDVVTRYGQVEDCAGAINRGEGIGPTCDVPTAALASLISAEAEADGIRVEWYVTYAGAVAVERRADGGEWRALLTTSPDGSGRVEVADGDVQPGHRYDYRLRMGQAYAGEVSLEVPAVHRLALAGFHPNPAVGPLSVSLALQSAAPARLEILDVAGRRVFAQAIERPAPGPRQVTLSGLRLAPGVYVLRLEQSGSRIVNRSVVLR